MSNPEIEGMCLQTRVLHESNRFNGTHAVTPPIWQTSTFTANSFEHIVKLGESTRPAGFYTRYGNPRAHAAREFSRANERRIAVAVSAALIINPWAAGYGRHFALTIN